MASIIRIKENDEIEEMLSLLQKTVYKGLGKTEIFRLLLADKAWEVKKQLAPYYSPKLTVQEDKQNYTAHRTLSPTVREEIDKAYESYKNGDYVSVKAEDLDEFLDSLSE